MFRAFVAVALASLIIVSLPARAGLIQDFTFSGIDVSGSGTVQFDGAGMITYVDVSGTAWGWDFAGQDDFGIGNVDPNWVVTDWSWGFFIDLQSPVQLAAIGTNSDEIVFTCLRGVDGCFGPQPEEETVTVAFTPRQAIPEPAGLTLLATGLVGLGLIRRRRRLKMAA